LISTDIYGFALQYQNRKIFWDGSHTLLYHQRRPFRTPVPKAKVLWDGVRPLRTPVPKAQVLWDGWVGTRCCTFNVDRFARPYLIERF
jgi:hypothetical protein